jgi:co-chaperonin GroES (HSP10)
VIGNKGGVATKIVSETGLKTTSDLEAASVILIDDFDKYEETKEKVDAQVKKGKRVVFLELPEGEFHVAGTRVLVEKTTMGDYYFVNPQTNHDMTKSFKPFDFRFWVDGNQDLIRPILSYTFTGDGWKPILTSGASNWVADKGTVMAAGELKSGKGAYIINEVNLTGKIKHNPTAREFLGHLLD